MLAVGQADGGSEGDGVSDAELMNIEKIIEGLTLIEVAIPSYKYARRKGLTDEEAEELVYQAIEQAILVLEQMVRGIYQ